MSSREAPAPAPSPDEPAVEDGQSAPPADVVDELDELDRCGEGNWSDKTFYVSVLSASVEPVAGASELAQRLLSRRSDAEGSSETQNYYGNAAHLLVAQAEDADTVFRQAQEILSQNDSPALRRALLYQIGARYEGFEPGSPSADTDPARGTYVVTR